MDGVCVEAAEEESYFVREREELYGFDAGGQADEVHPAIRAESVQEFLNKGIHQILEIGVREWGKTLHTKIAGIWERSHSEQTEATDQTPAPEATVAKKGNSALDRAEALIAELSDDNIQNMSIEELVGKINMLSAVWHGLMKKATKEISKANEKVREVEIQNACKELRSWKTATLTLVGGAASLGAGVAGLTPKPFHAIAGKVSSVTGGRVGGDIVNRFNMNDPGQLAKAGKAYAGVLSSAGQMSDGAGRVMQGSSQSRQVASQSAADAAVRNKDEQNQESSREGNAVDESQRKVKEIEDRRHSTFEGMARG